MKTADFYHYYPLEELDVLEIVGSDSGLAIVLDLSADMDFVGNHVRTDFAQRFIHRFDFPGVYEDILLSAPIVIRNCSYRNGILSFVANGTRIEILEGEVSITSNYRIQELKNPLVDRF